MSFLIRHSNRGRAHIWTGADTQCRMYSTGGLKPSKYKVVDKTNLPICNNCKRSQGNLYPSSKGMDQNWIQIQAIKAADWVANNEVLIRDWDAFFRKWLETAKKYRQFNTRRRKSPPK